MRRRTPAIATGLVAGLAALAAACSSSGPPTGPSSGPPTSPSSSQPAARAGAVGSAGCRSATALQVTNQPESIDVGGTRRTYLLTTPAAHRQPLPLVLDFHGYAEGDVTEARATGLGELGQHDGFITAFPEGIGKPVAWNTSTRPGNPDLRYVAALLDRLEATQCVDTARIYATGLSQGAFMTSTLACAMSNRIAAFAPVAGIQLPSPCPARGGVPILAFHGTADPILHFNGGLGLAVLKDDLSLSPKPFPKLPKPRLDGPGYPAHVRAWAAKDGCRPTPTDTRLSPHVIHRSYSCPPGAAVQFDIVLGGGHSWPGSALDELLSKFVGPTTMEINASQRIWAFFQRFRLAHPAS
jgi:polyhydroxybutyrate depolymerase